MTKKVKHMLLYAVLAICLLSGGCCIGRGIGIFIDENNNRSIDAEEDAVHRGFEFSDSKNQLILELMDGVTTEQKISFISAGTQGTARISNSAENTAGVVITIVSDFDGSTLYQSKVIDPGYFIEDILLEKKLKAGEYPCTVIYNFYSSEDELIGEGAKKIVILIES
jgi:predicted SPOUT superfamily RNA methylase MTH1